MEKLSQILWRERELLETLLFKLEEEQMVLAGGRTRWLTRAAREVENVLDTIRETEILRAVAAEEVAAELGLPERSIALFGMCVGYADAARPAVVKPRLPQALVLHRERYDASAAAARLAHYDAVMGRFYTGQGLPQPDWSLHVAGRLAGPASLHGREHLVAILNERGFRLR